VVLRLSSDVLPNRLDRANRPSPTMRHLTPRMPSCERPFQGRNNIVMYVSQAFGLG
jgi:hypothetical protein